jgi:predicted enzyme related to lactoylglutathione lyase
MVLFAPYARGNAESSDPVDRLAALSESRTTARADVRIGFQAERYRLPFYVAACRAHHLERTANSGIAGGRGMSDGQPIRGVRYGHTNIIATDWRRLADFYAQLFGCEVVPPERDYGGPDLARGTGVPDAAIRGVHLRLPGHGANGPTLEIYSYPRSEERLPSAANRLGLAHIAFEVEDVAAARESVLASGGQPIGEIVTLVTTDSRGVTWCYVTDPEDNIVELQSWT